MASSRRRYLWLLLLPVLGAGVFWLSRTGRDVTRFSTVAADRGDVIDVVGATGVLQAVITVQVGSQVSGTINWLGADFNSIVKKGQVVAKLEQSAFRARLNQSAANLASARANVDRSQAAIDDAKQKYQRAQELAKEQLLPQSDLETARATYQSAVAQHQANKAAVKQAEASLNQAQVDLDHTVITAPVDGVVLARNVDIGQTVAASFTAPVLFVIANDLSRMQVNASIDEADIGRVKLSQNVTFTVDAFPEQRFQGRVEQVRLQPVTAQNVVTYNTIISVDNPSLRLMPGMTATVSVIVRSRENALRIPTSALRFRPAGFEDKARGPRGGSAAAASGPPGSGPAALSGAGAAAGGPRPGGGGSRPGGAAGEGGGWRRRAEGRDAARAGADGAGAGGGGSRPGLVFVLDAERRPTPKPVRVGLSDGRFVEVIEGLTEGDKVVTGIEEAGAPRTQPSAAGTTNPFQPGRFQPRAR